MARLIVAPSAQQDLSDIYDYIARDKPIAAANWVEKIEEKCKLIAAIPRRFDACGVCKPPFSAGYVCIIKYPRLKSIILVVVFRGDAVCFPSQDHERNLCYKQCSVLQAPTKRQNDQLRSQF